MNRDVTLVGRLIRSVWEGRSKQPSGGDCQVQMAKMRARFVARYRLHEVPGRPEELRDLQTGKRISLAYASKSIRVRFQDGRRWLDRIDLPVYPGGEGWQDRAMPLTDAHFGYIDQKKIKPPRTRA